MHNHLPLHSSPPQDHAAREYLDHSSAHRVNTDTVIANAIRSQYPQLHLTITPADGCNLLSFAAAGHASAKPLLDHAEPGLKWAIYLPPPRRLDGQQGVLAERVLFGKYEYAWDGHTFILYLVDGRDGDGSYPPIRNNYVLSSSAHRNDELILAASSYQDVLHNEIWEFKNGWWQKSAELWDSVQKASWDDVILDEDMKKAIIGDVVKFFDSRDTYAKLKVPWKRGIIYYGPPGNGKTISIKAMMNQLYKRSPPIPTLYVRSLASIGGPEYALSLIFDLARRTAPCYLIFEDLDSLISPYVRSFFLNKVDGITNNDGILMLGSTNHLELLDPGIAKRPSRFDRKYFFATPNLEQRTKYCQFWRTKLKDNDDVEFPKELCPAIAGITGGFSFAYIQEAFVAALLAIAGRSSESPSAGLSFSATNLAMREPPYSDLHFGPGPAKTTHDDFQSALASVKTQYDDLLSDLLSARTPDMATLWEKATAKPADNDRSDLDKYILWKEIKKQVKNLRDELDNE